MAEDQMERKGFNGNFSAYVADLIRDDKNAAAANAAATPSAVDPATRVLVDAHYSAKLKKLEAESLETPPPKSPTGAGAAR